MPISTVPIRTAPLTGPNRRSPAPADAFVAPAGPFHARIAAAVVRLRIVLVVILAAVVGVLLFLPLPGWMVAEQCVCGLLLLAAAVLAFRVSPRAADGR
ncbi:hypothetical protein IL992_38940 [Microbispora sp. NEAU-D428]|uniref:hypothetical protein n=1 Tax=Microbispora sitophila TaxID=2771537 RepID=UPI001867962E|nr:hypothetical protein [Microbispora sitophila]MBE3015102.1 hypothetical protein [Microbispora sitophila]